jgi:hypothetical protein
MVASDEDRDVLGRLVIRRIVVRHRPGEVGVARAELEPKPVAGRECERRGQISTSSGVGSPWISFCSSSWLCHGR